jgi:hypothetical protein
MTSELPWNCFFCPVYLLPVLGLIWAAGDLTSLCPMLERQMFMERASTRGSGLRIPDRS